MHACTNNFDFHAAVLGAASCSLVVCDWLRLALAFCVDAVSFDTLGNQVCLNSFSAANRQLLVVSNSTNGVSMTDSDDHFQVQTLQVCNQFVQLVLAGWLQNCLVEIKERISSVSDLLRCWSSRSWSWLRSFWRSNWSWSSRWLFARTICEGSLPAQTKWVTDINCATKLRHQKNE